MDESPQEPKLPWYYGKGSLVVAFLCVGPLMMPLLWLHPRMTMQKKILWTVILLIVSYFLVVATIGSIKKIAEYYQQIQTLMP